MEEMEEDCSVTIDDEDQSNDDQSHQTQMSAARLENEFRRVLSLTTNSDQPNPSIATTISTSTTDETVSNEFMDEDFSDHNTGIPIEAVQELQILAKRMNSAGTLQFCVSIYASVRKPFLEACFRKLAVQRLSARAARKSDWGVLDKMIRDWIRAAKICFRVLFVREKWLCEQIFDGLGQTDISDACFAQTVKDCAVHLFNFAEAVTYFTPAPQKLFRVLDLYRMVSELSPQMNVLFLCHSLESTRNQVARIRHRLVDIIRGILTGFATAVIRDQSRTVSGGAVHPLTKYVLKYITEVCDHQQALVEVIVDKPSSLSTNPITMGVKFAEAEGQSPLSLHLIWIVMSLLFNLEGKAKLYADPSLACVFTMNNVLYIVQKIEGCPKLREIIGEDYLRKLTGKFYQAIADYVKSTSDMVKHCLRNEGLHGIGIFSSRISKSALRDRFKTFNGLFEALQQNLAPIVVPDSQIRDDLRKSILDAFIPAYIPFLERYRKLMESTDQTDTYVKYSAAELSSAILVFFRETPNEEEMPSPKPTAENTHTQNQAQNLEET